MRSVGLKVHRKVDETTTEDRYNKSYISRVKNRAMWEHQKGRRSAKGFTGARKVVVTKQTMGSGASTTDFVTESNCKVGLKAYAIAELSTKQGAMS